MRKSAVFVVFTLAVLVLVVRANKDPRANRALLVLRARVANRGHPVLPG
jgi:hypothetical protein